MKKYQNFYRKKSLFGGKILTILNRRVFVMSSFCNCAVMSCGCLCPISSSFGALQD